MARISSAVAARSSGPAPSTFHMTMCLTMTSSYFFTILVAVKPAAPFV